MPKRILASLGRVILVVVLASASRAQTTINFVGDATWQAFEMSSDGTRGPSLGSPLCENWNAYIDLVPGACWMWKPGVDGFSIADLQGVYLVKTFQLTGTPTSGHISVAVDDFAAVDLNGHLVGTTGSVSDYYEAATAQSTLKTFDLLPYLVSGANTLIVFAQNGPSSFAGGRCNPCNYVGNPAGVVFGGSLSSDSTVPSRTTTWGKLKEHYR